MKINEIFYSLQGEGRYTGTPAIFIRFAGCNLQCGFCDTKHQVGKQYTEEEILREIASFPAKRVILTGGEPTLQLTESFINALHDAGYSVNVETNGTRPLPCKVDWLVCSPKAEKIVLEEVDELKVVFQTPTFDMTPYEAIPAKERYVQPCDTKDRFYNQRIINAAIDYIKANPTWKLSLQTQKILNIR